MLIAFRVDIAKHIGTGHLQRCLTLADVFEANGHKCLFFLREYSDGLCAEYYNDPRFYVIGKSIILDIGLNSLESEWTGCSEENDAEDFLSVVERLGLKVDVVVIDHYSLSIIWEEVVFKGLRCAIAVIDDLANRKHACDLLIDQNYYLNYEIRYKSLISEKTKILLGPRYAILKPIFHKLRDETELAIDDRPKILVNFGGVANLNIWNIVLPALKETVNLYRYTVVTGCFQDVSDFTFLKSNYENESISFLETTDEMARMMLQNHFSLGACGTTVWERFALGLNSALMDIAPNQTELIISLTKRDLIDYLGPYSSLCTEDLIMFLQKLDLTVEGYCERRRRVMRLVDGLGANRIVSCVESIVVERRN